MTAAIDVLLDARTLLARRRGWVKGKQMSPRRGGGMAYCLRGAIEATPAEPLDQSLALWRLSQVLGQEVTSFNDRRDVRKKDVLDAIDRAISVEWSEGSIGFGPSTSASVTPSERLRSIIESEPFLDLSLPTARLEHERKPRPASN